MGNPGSETIVRLAHVNSVICIIVHLKLCHLYNCTFKALSFV